MNFEPRISFYILIVSEMHTISCSGSKAQLQLRLLCYDLSRLGCGESDGRCVHTLDCLFNYIFYLIFTIKSIF